MNAMKKTLTSVRSWGLSVILGVCSFCSTGATLPDPVVWFDMESASNGKVVDRSGNGHDLTLESGAVLTNGCGGASENALFFKGSKTSSASFACPALGSRTVSFWFRRGAGSGELTYDAGNTYPYLISDLSSLRINFSNKDGEGFKSYIFAQNGQQSAKYFAQSSIPAFWRETWMHFAMTLDVTSEEVVKEGVKVSHVAYKAYVNGMCVASPSTDFIVTNLAVSGTAWLGNFFRNYNRPIYGAIDDFRIWNTALDAGQVAAEYERAHAEKGDPLVGRWSFDSTSNNGSGSLVLKDVVGQVGDITCGAGIIVTNAGVEGNAIYCNGYKTCYGSFTLPDAFHNGITWTCWINQSPDSWKNTQTKIGGDNNAPRLLNGGSWYVLSTRGAKVSDWDTRKVVLQRIANNAAEDACDNSRAPQGSWGHLAVTTRFFVNASGARRCTSRIYMNGELAETIPERDVGSAGFATAWCFMNNTGNGTRPFEGFVDDLRLYAGEIPSNTIVRLFRGAAAVNAGIDFSVADGTAELHGEIDSSAPEGFRTGYAGVPRWTLVSAPTGGEGVEILQPRRTTTQVKLPVVGEYVFRLSNVLEDVGLERHDDVTVTRIAEAGTPPSLSLSASSVSGEVDIPVTLAATVTDGARVHWAKVSGPGGAWFEPANDAATKVRFGEAGTYVVRCVAEKDGTIARADVTVTVSMVSEKCDLSDGLLGWWPLSGADMLKDKGLSSARPNMMTNAYGEVWSAFEEGVAGLAFRPNGFGAYFPVGDVLRETRSKNDDANSPPNERYRAFSAWIYHDAADTNDSKYAVIFMVPYTLGLWYNANCTDGTPDGLTLYQQGLPIDNGTSVGTMERRYPLPYSFKDRWTHIYALFDRSSGTDFEVWVDGVAQTAADNSRRRGRVRTSGYVGGIPYDASSQQNGYWKRSGSEERMSRCFPGKIADLRIYNRKLTQKEIKTLAANKDLSANRAPSVDSFVQNDVKAVKRKPEKIAIAVFDDGQPTGMELSYRWSVLSGDASCVAFGDVDARETTFTASKTGVYVLQLTVSDGERTVYSEPLKLEVMAGMKIVIR